MLQDRKHNYIELFAGCGGMSLGLESAGFHRILANEISPMAAETFAYNLVAGARSAPHPTPGAPASWSPYFEFIDPPPIGAGGFQTEIMFRNWRGYARAGREPSDQAKAALMGKGSSDLLVGDAGRLVGMLESLQKDHPKIFCQRFGNIDLLAGGPPCQSFSLAGKRQRDHPRNRLFESFVAIAKLVKPKVIFFENVLGITRPFIDEVGDEWHPWHEVCRAFKKAGYLPIPSLVNAADFGVPQSRSRFMMVAVAESVANLMEKSPLNKGGLAEAFRRARTRYDDPSDDREMIFRAEIDIDKGLWPYPLFPLPATRDQHTKVTVRAAIEDLLAIEEEGVFAQGSYSTELARQLKRRSEIRDSKIPLNHSSRTHTPQTRARFRILRVLAEAGFWAKNMGDVFRKSEVVINLLVGKALLVIAPDGNYIERKRATQQDVVKLIENLSTAKNVQKCLDPNKPAAAQLSIPDDLIHWDEDRVLTVREMARIQSFPDWFVFRSKETTGGSARAYEVPQYTQVGNAVPPLLAHAFGKSIRNFLGKIVG
jgi:DNA (cytosine-5)-methyltransferase 1